MKYLAQGFNTAAHDLNLGSLSQESKDLPLSHCALHLAPQPGSCSQQEQLSYTQLASPVSVPYTSREMNRIDRKDYISTT